MATTAELGDGAPSHVAELNDQPFVLRSYQAEMVEESLKSNIIVVMDTGSGKTHMFVRVSKTTTKANSHQCCRAHAS